ncbi:MAG: ABC transporter [Flavobacterium sp. BFFFF2]|nr:MAG: ABC transporter [Flavobacterium sp. BFFFF2]
MKELQYLNKYFIKYKYRFLVGILITIVAQIFSLFTPQLIRESFDAIETHYKSNQSVEVVQQILLKNVGLVIISTLIAGVLTFLMRQTLIVMSRHVEFDLKNEVFQHYERLSTSFYKRNRTGDLMSRISEDVAKVRMYVGPAVMYTINTLIRFSMVILYMYAVSPKLTLYTLLPLPILSIIIFKLSQEINIRSTSFQQYLSKVSSFSQEVFSGIRVLKAYSLESNYQDKMADLAQESQTKSMSLARVQSLFGPLMIALIGVSNLVVIYVGGTMYAEGKLESVGVIAQFILYVNMLTWPVASIGWVSSLIQEAEASQKRINEFLKEVPEIQNEVPHLTPVSGSIRFDKVSFTYPETGVQAIKDVTFSLEQGKTLAILGRTGSGKSTLLSLITRLYDIDAGHLYIDDKPIRSFNLFSLRAAMGNVPQDAFLFSDTIANNIRFGDEEATLEEIRRAAKWAAVDQSIIEFSQGYETLLGERGITLSGGQKQRVSIARAFIKNAPILLLDDCLSAVDTETEEEILQNLKQIADKKTTIIVSHRVSSAKNADWIIVLDQGSIVQQGTHSQLVSIEGYYGELYEKQLSEKEIF